VKIIVGKLVTVSFSTGRLGLVASGLLNPIRDVRHQWSLLRLHESSKFLTVSLYDDGRDQFDSVFADFRPCLRSIVGFLDRIVFDPFFRDACRL
jgi:hypothetical protein